MSFKKKIRLCQVPLHNEPRKANGSVSSFWPSSDSNGGRLSGGPAITGVMRIEDGSMQRFFLLGVSFFSQGPWQLWEGLDTTL